MDANNNSNKGRAVSFDMKHLLTAFSIGAENTTDEQVTVLKMALEGVHSEGSAIIDYSGSSVQQPTYTTSLGRTPITTPFIIYDNSTGYKLNGKNVADDSNKVGNVFTGDPNKTYYMIWPQKAEVVSPTNRYDDNSYKATDSILIVHYKMGTDDKIYKKRVKFPNAPWKAGEKNHFDILFADQMVTVKATVNPWKYSSTDVSFSNHSVNVNKKLSWTRGIVDNSKKTVTFNSGQPIEASFAINTPLGAQWKVTLEGDLEGFTITDDYSNPNDGIGPVDTYAHKIHIIPKSNPDRDYTAQLKFVVMTADGKVMAIDGFLQDVDGRPETSDIYTLILKNAN